MLAKVLDDNNFDLIVVVNLLYGKKLTKHKRLADSLRNVVTVKGTFFAKQCNALKLSVKLQVPMQHLLEHDKRMSSLLDAHFLL